MPLRRCHLGASAPFFAIVHIAHFLCNQPDGSLAGICFREGALSGSRAQRGLGNALTVPHKGMPRELKQERRKTMRGYSNYYQAHTVNITNVTNITTVTHSHSHSHGSHGHGHGRKHVHHDRHDRPPKLTRFCATCGLLDYDKASRMSDGQMLDESANVVAYGCRGLAHSTGKIASNLGVAAKSLCGIAVAIGSAIFGDK